MGKKVEILSKKEIEAIVVRKFWGPYTPKDMIKMVHATELVLEDLVITESTHKATQDVENWMGWLEKRIVINPAERDYVEFALRQIRK